MREPRRAAAVGVAQRPAHVLIRVVMVLVREVPGRCFATILCTQGSLRVSFTCRPVSVLFRVEGLLRVFVEDLV